MARSRKNRTLPANGFGSGQTVVFDLTRPSHRRVAPQFGDPAGYTHPHSFFRAAERKVLATFQMRHQGGAITAGGRVELTPAGTVVRSSNAHYEGGDPDLRV